VELIHPPRSKDGNEILEHLTDFSYNIFGIQDSGAQREDLEIAGWAVGVACSETAIVLISVRPHLVLLVSDYFNVVNQNTHRERLLRARQNAAQSARSSRSEPLGCT